MVTTKVQYFSELLIAVIV